MKKSAASALAILALIADHAAANARLDFAEVASGSAVDGNTYEVIVAQGRVGVAEPASPGLARIIFRQESGEIVFIDHAHREYTVMTEAWLREANEKAEQAFEQSRERLKAQSEDLSPTAKKRAEQAESMMRLMPLMGGLFGDGAQKTISYSRTGRFSEYREMRCAQHDEITDGKRSRIVCLADAEAIGLDAEDVATLDRFVDTLVRIHELGVTEFGFDMPFFMVYDASLQGFPIAASDPDQNGYVLLRPASHDVNLELIEVPEGYLEAEIPLFGF